MPESSSGGIKKSGDYKIPNMVAKTFNIGDIIIAEGGYDSGAYKIIKGEVEVTKMSRNATVKLATLEKGAIFGEMTLIDKKPHSATVIALSEVECIYFDRTTFENELAESSPVIREMLYAFSQRLRGADERISSQLK